MNIPFADGLLHAYVSHGARSRAMASIDEWRAADTSRVLLLLTTGLGDAVLSTPVFPAIRRALPRARIQLLCRETWAPLFEADPDLDGVVRYPGKYRRFFPLVSSLRGFAPDLTLILHGNDPDVVPLAFLARSRFIVRIPTAGTRYAFLLSNRGREADRATVPGVHYVDNRLRILDTLGIPAATSTPRIHLDPAFEESAARALRGRFGGKSYWVLHACAADAYKTWPLENARALIQRMRERHPDFAVALTGSQSDRAALERVASDAPDVHVLAGDLDIRATAACLKHAHAVVAPDTGVLHLAAALGAPVIGLYGATNAALVGPRSPGAPAVVIQKPVAERVGRDVSSQDGMARIEIEEVLAALDSVIDA